MNHRDLERIAFVTRRFESLHGLQSVSYGAALMAGVLGYQVMPRDVNPMQYLIVAQLIGLAAAAPIQRFYRRVFGSVSRGFRSDLAGRSRPFGYGYVLPMLVQMGLSVDLMHGGRFGSAASLGAALLLTGALRTMICDWPHRGYYAIAVFAGAVALALTAGAPVEHREIWQPMSATLVEHYMLACGIIGVAFIAAGLLDHHLLSQSFFGRSAATTTSGDRVEYFAETRLAVAGTVFASLVVFLGVAGWPSTPTTVVALATVIPLPLLAVTVLGSWREAMGGLTAYREMEQVREAKLKAFVATRLGKRLPEPLDVKEPVPRLAPPDRIGHLILPLAMAAGALADVALQPSGLPSLLAIALCLSHARIAARDWPTRRHYVIGVAAAAACAVAHMFIGIITPVDWIVGFLLVMSGAMSIEAWCDRSLAPVTTSQNHGSDHAHAV